MTKCVKHPNNLIYSFLEIRIDKTRTICYNINAGGETP